APGLLVCWGMMVEGSGDSVKWWGVAGIGGSGFVESGGKDGRMNRVLAFTLLRLLSYLPNEMKRCIVTICWKST
nr:hypothetical protein [Tanacetum cinerariifolium]